MTNLRRKRLLLLATKPKGHKRFYSHYCILIGEGLVGWCMGYAFLTELGQQWLKENSDE